MMHASTAFILSLLLPLAQAVPSPVMAPTVPAVAQRAEGHIARGNHPFAASANHKARLVRRKKPSSGVKRRAACVAKGGPGPVIVHSDKEVNATSTATVASVSAATTATGAATSTTIAAQVGLAKSNSTSSAVAPSSTASSAAASPSPSPSSSSGSSSPLGNLFPVRGSNWWSTSDQASPHLSVDGALKPLTAGKLPAAGTAPDGSSALVANFPAGTVKITSTSGFSFYTEGEHNGVVVEGAKEVLFSYSVYFESGFDFVKGGKMPGLYGGTSLSQAKTCSGGRQDNRDECFSTRLMWRTDGMGEIYNYLPTSVQQGNGYCQTAPKSICDTTYGDSIGRGSYTWATGAWTTVAQRIKLNDVGQANGEQQLWVNGQPIMHLTGLQLIVKEAKIYGIMAQTFFGGSDQSWASPKDQSAWFKDWSMTVVQ